MPRLIKKMDQIRLKNGSTTGTVIHDQYGIDDKVIHYRRNNIHQDEPDRCAACRHEIVLMKPKNHD